MHVHTLNYTTVIHNMSRILREWACWSYNQCMTRTDIDIEVGNRVNNLMWRKRLRREDIASVLGLTGNMVGRKIRGDSSWSASDLVLTAQALGVTPGELLPVAPPTGLEPVTL